MSDRVLGGILGAVLGDCLGMPYEFSRKKNQGLDAYSRELITTTFNSQFQGKRTTALGQGSDDSEMILAILGSLVDRRVYDPNDVLLRYMVFANFSSFCGKNTRSLFKGVKTINGYNKRFTNMPGEPSQSNGYLMRAPAFMVLKFNTAEELIQTCVADACLTNPGPVNSALSFVYSSILNFLCYGNGSLIESISNTIVNASERWPESSEILKTLLASEVPDISKADKGWARHSLHLAINLLLDESITSYAQGVENAIKRGGDTDTNGCIVGAVLGAKFGLRNMITDPITERNLQLVLECDTTDGDYTRPVGFRGSDLAKFLDVLVR